MTLNIVQGEKHLALILTLDQISQLILDELKCKSERLSFTLREFLTPNQLKHVMVSAVTDVWFMR